MNEIPVFELPDKCNGCCELNGKSSICIYSVCLNVDKDTIDRCILPELEELWDNGIETMCSCCGHGEPEMAWIVVGDKYYQHMIDLGYQERLPQYDYCSCGVFFRAKLKVLSKQTNN